MSPFDLLKDDAAQVKERMDATIKNYSVWNMDHVFESTKKCFEGIRRYIRRKNVLVSSIVANPDILKAAEQTKKSESELISDIENLVMIHIDEPGFEIVLEKVVNEFHQYCNLCETDLFPRIGPQLSQQDLHDLNLELIDTTYN